MIDLTIDINVFDLLINVFLSAGVAILTAWLALKHFYKQEKWLRKEKKYTEIIDSLAIMLKYNDIKYELFTNQIQHESEPPDLEAEYETAKNSLKILRYKTGFLIKREVSEILDDVWKSFQYKTLEERQGNMEAYIARIYNEIDEATQKIIKIAEKDLKKWRTPFTGVLLLYYGNLNIFVYL